MSKVLRVCGLKSTRSTPIVHYVGKNNIGKAVSWSADDINSYDVEYTTENELVVSEEVQKQRFFEMYNMGMFTDSDGKIPERVKLLALQYARVGNYADIMNIHLLQIQSAQRENVFFESGVIPKVSEFDDHDVHIEEHLRYLLQMDFQILRHKKPEYAAAFENHVKEHQQIAELEKQRDLYMQMNGSIPPQV